MSAASQAAQRGCACGRGGRPAAHTCCSGSCPAAAGRETAKEAAANYSARCCSCGRSFDACAHTDTGACQGLCARSPCRRRLLPGLSAPGGRVGFGGDLALARAGGAHLRRQFRCVGRYRARLDLWLAPGPGVEATRTRKCQDDWLLRRSIVCALSLCTRLQERATCRSKQQKQRVWNRVGNV